MKKHAADIYCNLDFIEIYTISSCNVSTQDPLGDDFYFSLNASTVELGEAIKSAISKSRDLSSTSEEREYYNKNCPPDILSVWDGQSMEKLSELKKNMNEWHEKYQKQWLKSDPNRALFERELIEQRYADWIAYAMKTYKYKSKTAMFKNMQACSVTMEKEIMKFFSRGQDESSKGTSSFTIPSTSSPEIIGAAVKYSIARCTGKGADLVAKKLIPDGVPGSFEEYLKLLSLA